MHTSRRELFAGLGALLGLAVLPKPREEEVYWEMWDPSSGIADAPYSIPSFVNEDIWVNPECLQTYTWRFSPADWAWSEHEVLLNG